MLLSFGSPRIRAIGMVCLVQAAFCFNLAASAVALGNTLAPPEQAVQPLRMPTLNWDSSYSDVFDKAQVSEQDTVRKFFYDSAVGADYAKSTALDLTLFDALPASLDAAVLIDYQAFYYMGHRVVEFSYGAGAAGDRRAWNSRNHRIEHTTIPADAVSQMARALMRYEPRKSTEVKPYNVTGAKPGEFVFSGYIGVVSVMVDGQRRQFPIVADEIMRAAANGKPATGYLMRYLQVAQMNPDERDAALEQDRQYSAFSSLLQAARDGDVATLRRELPDVQNINQEVDGATILLQAVSSGNIEAVEVVLSAGADPSVRTRDGNNALARAAGRGSLPTIQLLERYGADVRSTQSWDALSAAVRFQRIPELEYLLNQGASLKPGPTQRNPQPLLFLAFETSSNMDIARLLIQRGVDVNEFHNARTPLMELAANNRLAEKLRARGEVDGLVSLLLETGADIDRTSVNCWTALSWARHMRNEQLLSMLVARGANENREQQCKTDLTQVAEDMPAGNVASLSPVALEKLIQESGKPVCVHMYAGWARPAVQLRAVLARLSLSSANKFQYAEFDVSQKNPDARRFLKDHPVDVVPTLLIFDQGKLKASKRGFTSEQALTDWLDSL